MKTKLRPVALAVLALCSSLPGAYAQTAPAAPAAPAESTLGEIKVQAKADAETATGPVDGYAAKKSATATKTDTLLGETPQSVTVVTGDEIRDMAPINISEALNYAAGVRGSNYGVDSRGDWARVRGADPVQYLDGLQLMFGYNNNTRIEPYSLERIEVLRGPASVLYGQGSTAGLINMVSKRPLDGAGNEIGLSVGNYNRLQVEGDLNGRLNPEGSLLYRVVFVGRESDTQVDYVPDNVALLAPSLTWQPDANTSWTVMGRLQKNEAGSSATFLPWSGTILPNPNGQIPTSRFVSEPTYDKYDTDSYNLTSLFEHRFANQWVVRQSTRWAYTQGDYQTLYPLSNFNDPLNPYVNPEQTDITRAIYANKRNAHTLQADQNLQGTVMTGNVTHLLLFGLDYTNYRETAQSAWAMNDIPFNVYDPVYGNYSAPPLYDDPRVRQSQLGVYAQDQMKFGPNWMLMLGARYDDARSTVGDAPTETDNATTGRAALMYLSDFGWSPYVSYSESFLPIAGTDFYNERYKPLRGEQWEVGVKFATADDRFAFNAAAYDLKEKNRQVSDPTNPLNQLQTGETTNRGVELEARGSLTPAIALIANYNYVDIDEQLEQGPKNSASVWGKWNFAVGGTGGFAAGLGVRYAEGFKDGDAPRIPSVTLLDALLAWETPQWRLAFNASNLLDKTYVATCLSRGDCWWGARRNMQVSVSHRF